MTDESPGTGCENCPVHHEGNLIKLGVNMASWDYVVALAGNPNTGKSTVFNLLTGLRQKTGNFPGVTVEKRIGKLTLEGIVMDLVDLPGTYSLSSNSDDERIAVDDAHDLERPGCHLARGLVRRHVQAGG